MKNVTGTVARRTFTLAFKVININSVRHYSFQNKTNEHNPVQLIKTGDSHMQNNSTSEYVVNTFDDCQ